MVIKERKKEGRKEMFYLMTHSTHFIYGYMALYLMVKDHSVREETRCRHMGYSFRLTARILLYAPSHRQVSTYHDLCYTSRGALAGMKKEIYFIYGYMVLDIIVKNHLAREKTHCCHFMGYSFLPTARDLLYDHPTDIEIITRVSLGIGSIMYWE